MSMNRIEDVVVATGRVTRHIQELFHIGAPQLVHKGSITHKGVILEAVVI